MRLKAFNSEVFFPRDSIVAVRRNDIELLKKVAARSARLRARLCAHRRPSEKIHEMMIVLARGVYLRPHRHRRKVESFHVVQGRVEVVLFNKRGTVARRIALGDFASGLPFYYRMPEGIYHTLLVRSRFVVLHETTNGPFIPSKTTQYAPWAPDEAASAYAKRFQRG